MNRTHLAAAASLLLFLLPGPLRAAGSTETVVLLPFANISGAGRAQDVIEPALVGRLEERGFRVIRGEEVRAFLASERLRYIDSFSASERERLFKRFEARAAVLGTIHSFSEGENPVVGLSSRMVEPDGKVLWSAAVGLTGGDTEGALGLKRIASVERLAQMAVSRLVGGFPSPGKGAAASSGRAHRLGLRAPRTFRSAALAGGARHRVCLLPLVNRTSDRAGSRIVGELLSRRMAESPLFEVVEPADFRAAMVKARLAGLKNGDPAELKKLGDALGTSLFLTGAIDRYRDTSSHGRITPELELQLTLTDVAGGRILWTSSAARKGSDYSGLFELGAISNMVTLADQVAAEMVRAVETAHPKESGPAAGRTRTASRARVLRVGVVSHFQEIG